MTVDVRSLLERIKRSEWYEVEVDLPPEFRLRGTVPYAIWTHSDGRARISVLAPDEDTATERVYEWLNSQDENS